MLRAQRNGISVSVEDEIGLTVRIQQEVVSMTFSKERYDADYPGHKKDLIPDELRMIAREKVIQELCIPLCTIEDLTEDRSI